MSGGDNIRAGRPTTAETTTDILGARPGDLENEFVGSVILQVGPQLGDLKPNITLDGIHGAGTAQGVPFRIAGRHWSRRIWRG